MLPSHFVRVLFEGGTFHVSFSDEMKTSTTVYDFLFHVVSKLVLLRAKRCCRGHAYRRIESSSSDPLEQRADDRLTPEMPQGPTKPNREAGIFGKQLPPTEEAVSWVNWISCVTVVVSVVQGAFPGRLEVSAS